MGLMIIFILAAAIALVVGVQGACNHGGKVIQVRSLEDVQKRQDYPITESVTLLVEKDLSLSSSLVLSQHFSCTILKSGGSGFTISSPHTGPALTIQGAANVLVIGLHFSNGVNEHSPHCHGLPYPYSDTAICPAVAIFDSTNVILAQGSVHGRVDMYQAERCSLDSLRLTSSATDFANVNVVACGDGPRLRKSLNSVTNCDISGAPVGVWLHQAAVGVSVTHNNFHAFAFSAVRCGLGQHNVGDCMLSTISYNDIHTDAGDHKVADNAGIYFASHWINPGNYLSCNYIQGGEHCLYLDWASSGITVDGGVCHKNVNGVKLNTGHSNTISSLIVSNPQGLAGWISCQNYDVNNCNRDPGSFWEQQRIQSFDSLQIRRRYPWMGRLCSQTSVSGVQCNPRGSAPTYRTGACSGLPTDNQVTLTLVDTLEKNTPTYLSCEQVPVAQVLNKLRSRAVASDPANFIHSPRDFGLTSHSTIYAFNSKFKSCPRGNVGPRQIDPSSFLPRIHA